MLAQLVRPDRECIWRRCKIDFLQLVHLISISSPTLLSKTRRLAKCHRKSCTTVLLSRLMTDANDGVVLGRQHQLTIWHINGTLVPLHYLGKVLGTVLQCQFPSSSVSGLGVEAPNILDPAILS